MVKFWIPRIGDHIKHTKSGKMGKLINRDTHTTKATIYTCDTTGCHHSTVDDIFEWELCSEYSHGAITMTSDSLVLNLLSPEEITKPERYNKKGKLECWDVILDQEMDFLEGSVLKYLWRYKQKNGKHDLEKAKVYIDKIIKGLADGK